MLGKDDAFKVVHNPARNPGADKRGLHRSGQVLFIEKNTGGANSWPSFRDRSLKGADIGAAQLFQFIRTGLRGQTLGCAERVPVAKGLWRGDAQLRCGYYAPNRLKVGKWRDLLTPVHSQNRASNQKERHIGTNLGGNHHPPRWPQRSVILSVSKNTVILSGAQRNRRTCGFSSN